jgi:hypothetical protein
MIFKKTLNDKNEIEKVYLEKNILDYPETLNIIRKFETETSNHR